MKFMNMKRFASVAMAGALALSLTAPAFASGNTTTIAGSYTPITLRVTVPATGAAIINPYGLPYSLGESTISGQQIVTTAPLVIQNRSAVALSVTANLSATASTGVTLDNDTAAGSADYTTETTKKLHVVFEAFKADELNSLNVTDNDTLRPMFAALDSADAVLTGAVTTTAADATGTLVLREAADGEVQSGGAAMFRLTGEAAKKATWVAEDTFSATIAFTFEPGQYTASAGVIPEPSRTIGIGTQDNSSATVTGFTPDLPDGVTATSTVWSSSDTTKMTVTEAAGTVTIKPATGATAGTADLIVTIVGSDGITYISSKTITIENNN